MLFVFPNKTYSFDEVLMKKLLIILTYFFSISGFAADKISYKVSKSMFPVIIKVGDIVSFNSDYSSVQYGNHKAMGCEKAPKGLALSIGASMLLMCGGGGGDDGDVYIFTKNNKEAELEGIASMSLQE